MKFFELEDCDGKKVLVNAEQITSIYKSDDNCTLITLTYCDCVITRTPYEDVVSMITNIYGYRLTHK